MATRASERSALWPALIVQVAQQVRRWWMWSLPLLAAIYLAIVARYFTTILVHVEYSADVTSAQVIGELFSHRGGSTVYLGDIAWYSTLFFELATKWLPGHRTIWDAGPYAIALGSVALMAWAAWRVAGRRAACLTAVLLVCASPMMLEQMFWLNNHMTTCYGMALLGAVLILLETRIDSMRRRTLCIVAVATGFLVGINMASDELLTMAAPISLMLASGAVWRLHPSARTTKALVWSGVMLVTMSITAAATTYIMESLHVYPGVFRLAFASSEAIAANFRYWWESIALLGNGGFFGETLAISSVLSAACAILVVVAVVLIPRVVWRDVERSANLRDASAAPVSAYLIFWASGALLLSAAFIFSSAPVQLNTTRYLTAVIYAAAAVVPFYARRGALARAAVVLGTVVFAITSIQGLLSSSLISRPTVGVTPEVAQEVAAAAESEGVRQGYAVYWDAAPLTWFSHMRVRAYPFFGCLENNMCPPGVNWIGNWYQLPRGERTFLLSDSKLPYPPPPEFGPAIATYTFGNVTMNVYNYNIGRYMR
jgi:hypothetical protein